MAKILLFSKDSGEEYIVIVPSHELDADTVPSWTLPDYENSATIDLDDDDVAAFPTSQRLDKVR